jgi:hypothetical protein
VCLVFLWSCYNGSDECIANCKYTVWPRTERHHPNYRAHGATGVWRHCRFSCLFFSLPQLYKWHRWKYGHLRGRRRW